jgi:hypothetical protein
MALEPTVIEPEPVVTEAEPVVAEAEAVVADAESSGAGPLDPERARSILDEALDALGSAHHRPFSRG